MLEQNDVKVLNIVSKITFQKFWEHYLNVNNNAFEKNQLVLFHYGFKIILNLIDRPPR